jgi:hypothetical protein
MPAAAMMCLGDWIAWSGAAINMALAAWQIARIWGWQHREQAKFDRWIAIEREQEAQWRQRYKDLEDLYG